jgi:hypothetical protein
MYPPLMPDAEATLDSITDGSIAGRYCFSIRWTRDGKPVKLTAIFQKQYFGLSLNGLPIDTSLTWYRIDPSDSSRVQIALRKPDSITLGEPWYVTYDAVADGEFAPLATIDPMTGDTIFATTFYNLPVVIPTGPSADVKQFNVQYVAPNPASTDFQCDILSDKHQTVTVDVMDDLGIALRSQQAVLEEGMQLISISTAGLPSGDYWIVVRDESGNESIQKAVFYH